MSSKHPLVLLLLLLSFRLASQQVTIYGSASSFPGKEIVAFRYQDYITWTRELMESDTVNISGKFVLHLDVKTAGRIYLLCDHVKAPLYVEPGRTYEVDFPRRDSSRMFNANVDQEGDLNIHFLHNYDSSRIDTTELNWLIIDYNLRFDDFWRKNYQAFIVKRMKLPLDSFSRATVRHYQWVKNTYFQTYLSYSMASTRVSTLESENILYRDYLANREVGYDNYEYMTFFNQFFEKYFYQFTLKPAGSQVIPDINEHGDVSGLMNDLKPAPYLGNDTLRELVMLKGLYENCNNKEISRQRMVQILEEASKKSRIAQHRLIARNILANITTLRRGTPAPPFSLPDKNGKIVNLSDYKGHYVYLCFGKSTSPVCLSDLKVLEDLEKKYPLVQVVSIMTDEKAENMKKMLKQNPKLR